MSTIPHAVQCLLERIITDTLDGHVVTVSIEGRQLTHLRFADNIDGLAGSKTDLRQLVIRLERASKDYGMEINGENNKVMTNNNNGTKKKQPARGWNTADICTNCVDTTSAPDGGPIPYFGQSGRRVKS